MFFPVCDLFERKYGVCAWLLLSSTFVVLLTTWRKVTSAFGRFVKFNFCLGVFGRFVQLKLLRCYAGICQVEFTVSYYRTRVHIVRLADGHFHRVYSTHANSVLHRCSFELADDLRFCRVDWCPQLLGKHNQNRTAESQPSQARKMHQKRWAIAIPMYNTICEQERADVVCLFMSGTSNIGPKLVTFVGESRSSNQSPNGERSLFRRESQHEVSAPWSRLPLLCSDGAWRTSWTSSLP